MKNILLGSHSLRRSQLLQQLNIPFNVVTIHYNESCPTPLRAGQITRYLALQKAQHYVDLPTEDILITADTIVWAYDKTIGKYRQLGKPNSVSHARTMLHLLSGQTHTVYTSIALSYYVNNVIRTDILTDRTEVTFNDLSQSDIENYLITNSPMDKAGAYGIQDPFALIAVRSIRGSFYNVMGLPIDLLYHHLLKLKAL